MSDCNMGILLKEPNNWHSDSDHLSCNRWCAGPLQPELCLLNNFVIIRESQGIRVSFCSSLTAF